MRVPPPEGASGRERLPRFGVEVFIKRKEAVHGGHASSVMVTSSVCPTVERI